MISETDLDSAESRINHADLASLGGVSGLRSSGLRSSGLRSSGLRSVGASGLRSGGGYRNLMLGGGSTRQLGQSRAVNAAAAYAAADKAGGIVAGGDAAVGTTGAAAGSDGLLAADYDDYGGMMTGPVVNNRRTAAAGLGSYGNNLGLSGYGGGGGTTGILNRGYGGGSGYGGGGSGYGGGGGYAPVNLASGYGPGVCEDKGLNPALVLATLAAAAVAFAVIYRQVTGGGRKFKKPPTTVQDYVDVVADLIWSGELMFIALHIYINSHWIYGTEFFHVWFRRIQFKYLATIAPLLIF
jgi:hypothetical protein